MCLLRACTYWVYACACARAGVCIPTDVAIENCKAELRPHRGPVTSLWSLPFPEIVSLVLLFGNNDTNP